MNSWHTHRICNANQRNTKINAVLFGRKEKIESKFDNFKNMVKSLVVLVD